MRILLAWEFGSNWGHLATLLPLAQSLRGRGHEVVFAVRGLDGDLSLLTAAGFGYLPMPIAIAPLQQMQKMPVRGYADVLARGGFADARTLMQLAAAWRGILQCVNPDVVICKYSPLAEFATRDRPVLSVGTGFELPPLSHPLPAYGSLSGKHRDALNYVEEIILRSVNSQGASSSRQTWSTVADAFKHTQKMLLTYPKLDHFGERADVNYFGGGEDLSAFIENDPTVLRFMNSCSGPVTFAYLRVGTDWLKDFLAAIQVQQIKRPFVIVNPTLTQSECEMFSSRACLVVNRPIDMKHAAERADLLICHAGHGTVVSALVRGKRLLLLPQYMEQQMLAHRVIASQPKNAGVALMVEHKDPAQVAEVHTSLLRMDRPQPFGVLQENTLEALVAHLEAMTREGG
jgi:Glycosyltransferase family 28 C-terminal domain